MIIGYVIDYKRWEEYSFFLMMISIFFLGIVLIPQIGHAVGGARRWLRFGMIGFQPSEFAKISFIFYTASWLDRKYQLMNKNFLMFFVKIFLFALAVFLIYMEPDLGTTILLVMIVFSMYIVAGLSKRYILGLMGLILPFIMYGLFSTPYRLKRVLAFLNPWQYFSDSGYQVVQSYLAIANAGFFGRGIGGSKLKLLYLPEAHTDFVFPIIIEELGFFGTISVVGFFVIFTYIGIKIALRTKNYFAKLTAFGITVAISYQALMNIAVVTGTIPTKGIPLPFFSFGGSSLVISMFVVGVLLNISKSCRK